jgi:hypothetical protein
LREITKSFTKWLQQGAIAFRSAAFLLAPALALNHWDDERDD